MIEVTRGEDAARMPSVMGWLRAGVPLTLLVDLLDQQGPDSSRWYAEEPADTSWVPPRRAVA